MSGDLKEGFVKRKKMGTRLNDLSLRFQTKGFMPIEISGLVKDIFYILDKGIYIVPEPKLTKSWRIWAGG